MRIVQEAITNVLKHAQAKTLTLRAVQEKAGTSNYIFIEIIDDGNGIPDTPSLGKELRNMSYRANAIGADLTIEPNDHGTRVSMMFPVGLAVLPNKAA